MEFIAILANTARSQAYLQTLLKENLKPIEVFILDDNNEKYLGKISNKTEISKDNKQSYAFKLAVMNPEEDLITTLSKTDIPYTIINTPDINSKRCSPCYIKIRHKASYYICICGTNIKI